MAATLLASHGRLTEVSHRVFVYSEVHSVIFIVLVVLAMPLAILANRQNKKRRH